MNECIDSTMGRIHVCLLCCLLVTIRGLVGSFMWSKELGHHLILQLSGTSMTTQRRIMTNFKQPTVK
jgi:hypothetical protein